ncbi:L7Ae/L30e/S12e/Gadd45 family ribosomal protein [Paenibacillus sp. MMS18-CY102]|jgi:large subunit ribosomal protein L7A|uniref:L7Ae/L30e/S12e/Gadd45 family ribosomal protein n=1 Tax=Paenibacillus sp. MMS18-CY102 TaxID=2682849 RepID=UPI0013659873|nr:ribosomal L7Ae/L30e/S12e/Gadd45 family protein [Paenibacillus sp. MMS18-CY102]MWC28311.1 50S ribosomal protein L7ae-like protein [Paenibacillus sp. MMS18-CY102]
MQYKIGTKQTTKMVELRKAVLVYVAQDADSRMTDRIVQLCEDYEVEVVWVKNMQLLGETCGIDVGAAMAAVVPDISEDE